MQNYIERNKIWVIVVVVLVVLVAGLYLKGTAHKNNYSVVYLTTGEVYVGKLTTFPGLELKDSYILQVSKDATDPNKNNFNLNPLKDALWATDSLHLNRKNVIFYGLLSPNSTIAKKLAEQGK